MTTKTAKRIDTVEKAKKEALHVWEAHTNQLDGEVLDALDRCSPDDLHLVATLAIRAGVYRDASLKLTKVKSYPSLVKEAHRSQQLLIGEIHRVQKQPVRFDEPDEVEGAD